MGVREATRTEKLVVYLGRAGTDHLQSVEQHWRYVGDDVPVVVVARVVELV